MAWWVRLIVTLVLAPLLWRAVGIYVESQQGGGVGELLQRSVALLGKVYLVDTLPAAGLLAIILPVDLLFRKLRLDLLVVGAAPLIACAVPFALARLWPAGVEAPGLAGLAVTYGLTWGLTIREPATSKGVETRGKAGDAAEEKS